VIYFILAKHVILRFRQIIALFCCLQLLGGSYGILQTIAWSRMIVNYTSNDGLIEGIKKTFDGEHPCAMCCHIAKAKQQDKAPDPVSDLLEKQGPVKHYILSPNLPEHGVFASVMKTIAPLAPPQRLGIGAEQPVSPPPRHLA
jgi:hypothetical protein